MKYLKFSWENRKEAKKFIGKKGWFYTKEDLVNGFEDFHFPNDIGQCPVLARITNNEHPFEFKVSRGKYLPFTYFIIEDTSFLKEVINGLSAKKQRYVEREFTRRLITMDGRS